MFPSQASLQPLAINVILLATLNLHLTQFRSFSYFQPPHVCPDIETAFPHPGRHKSRNLLQSWADLVRFPNPLALGSGLGLHCLSKWRIFLCSPPAWTIVIEHGQWGAYWISQHLTKPLAQFHFCSLTCLAASTPFLSSTRSQLLPPPDCNFCSMGVQLDLFSCCFIFLLCLPSWHPSWALSGGINVLIGEKPVFVTFFEW